MNRIEDNKKKRIMAERIASAEVKGNHDLIDKLVADLSLDDMIELDARIQKLIQK